MSKQIKQMQMDALRQTFAEVRDLVFLDITGLDSVGDNHLRKALQKKKITLHMVKNSLARRVFDELGVKVPKDSPYWAGSTFLSWGAGSLAELSKEIDAQLKDLVKKNAKLKDKLKVKGAISEGQQIAFDLALKMPTRAEAIGRVVSLALAPASRLVSQITAAGGNLAGQIKTLSEKKPEEAAAEAPAAASA
jgi:large subunit ribosomal protein L10